MRLLHTADWHIGRTLEGRSRFSEHAAFFQELHAIVKDENIDALIMAGDVFDSVNPPAAAEELFYESMAELTADCQIPAVIIAGNHDHPERLQAARQLAKTNGIFIRGYPDLSPLVIPAGTDVLQIAALPYPSESRLKTMLQSDLDERKLRDVYNDQIAKIFQELTKNFSPKNIGIGVSHIFIAGASSTDSERPIEVGGAYTVTADSLPENVQYTALGHLHRAQTVTKAAAPARYSGSPLAFSFSERGYAKSVTIVDARPGQPGHYKEIPLSSGRPLVRWEAKQGPQQVRQWLEEKRDDTAWIELDLYTKEAPSMEEIHQWRKTNPGIITIRPVFPEKKGDKPYENKKTLPLDELFKRYYEKQTGGAEPEKELVELFMKLLEEERENQT
ncbi:exonuclease SbcCD subunit D [Alteribacillus sp. HJP-4]|uniref:exonuclease SbcCD subunit D n=1 Tax=Alteribacillus sp. HJP-4 TaxID=2775394 RepID=UPI0035CD16A5